MACFNEDDFELVNGTHIRPKSYMQLRRVATIDTGANQSLTLNPRGGNQAQDIYTLQVSWLNPISEPYSQNVYGILTRGGSRVNAQARSVVYIETWMGAVVGVAPADPATSTLFGRFGNGGDMGSVSGPLTVFMNVAALADARSNLLGSTVLVAPGQTYKLKIRLRLDALFWESQAFQGGDNETDLSISTGETRLDLFAYPDL